MKKILIIFLLAASCGSYAQSDLKATQLNVFKNGTYFVAKEGKVQVRNGIAEMNIPVRPLMGTFWFTTTKDIKIDKVLFITDTIKTSRNPENMGDIVKGSIGHKVRLVYMISEQETRESSGTAVDYYPSSGIVKLKQSDNKTSYLPVSRIIEFVLEDVQVDKLKVDSTTRVARIYFEKNTSNADMKVVYMQAGIQWLPSYNIKIISGDELQLEMKATVENYAEDIEGADLTLTVGAPQFYFNRDADPVASDYLSPLGTQPATGYAFQPQAQSYYSNSIVTQDASIAGDYYDYQDYSDYGTEGEKVNDLYIYSLGKADLPRNSKTVFQIFSIKIPYKDVYETTVNDVVGYSSYGYISNDPEQRFDVFHSLQLSNTTGFPFTTAPVFVLSENLQPLAQDQIKYTPMGSNVSVQLSKAGDVIIKNKEEELKKEDNAKKLGKTYYNRVTIKGTINIENLQDKKILLKVKKNLLATITNADDGGKITKSGKYSYLNPYSDIEWEIPMGGKEKKTITYEYEVYVNSGLGSQ